MTRRNFNPLQFTSVLAEQTQLRRFVAGFGLAIALSLIPAVGNAESTSTQTRVTSNWVECDPSSLGAAYFTTRVPPPIPNRSDIVAYFGVTEVVHWSARLYVSRDNGVSWSATTATTGRIGAVATANGLLDVSDTGGMYQAGISPYADPYAYYGTGAGFYWFYLNADGSLNLNRPVNTQIFGDTNAARGYLYAWLQTVTWTRYGARETLWSGVCDMR